jgi:pilus assembly protein FimV
MAFGLRFNKAKVLAAAEKYVMQGKIPAAIQEYQSVLEQEPRDLVILNTVGDLYLRVNKTAEALTYFYKLGEAYVEDGFVRNGIAVFKKITRSDPNAIDAVSRLADLYTLQGQLNEARGYLNQAVDLYSQRGEHGKCVELFEKLLLMDPENVAAKQKLAAVYEQAGKKEDAAAMYFSAAEGFADRANPVEAERALRKARELGYPEADTIVLEARILVDSGRGSDAITALERIPDRDTNRAALNLLYHAHVSLGDLASAGKVATSIFVQFDDSAGVEQVAATMIERGDFHAALEVYETVAGRALEQSLAQPLIDGLKNIVLQDRENVHARRLLARLYQGTGQTGEFTDACEQLAEVLAQQQDYEAARAVYVQLTEAEPANPMHRQRIQQMDQKLGRSGASQGQGEEVFGLDAPVLDTDYTAESAPSSAAAFSAASSLDPISQHAVETALAEAEQQSNFMQFEEAVATLQSALAQVPGNIALNQKLVDVYEMAQRWSDAAAVCETLTESFVMAGDGDNATRYGDLMAKFQNRASGGSAPAALHADADEFPAVAEFSVPDEAPMGISGMEVPPSAPADTFSLPADFSVEAEAAPAPAVAPSFEAPPSSAETREVDLSNEWEALMVVDGATAEGDAPAPAVEAEPEPAPMSAPVIDSAPAVEEFTLDEFTLDAAPEPEPMLPAPPPPPPPVPEPVVPPPPAPAPVMETHEEEFSLDLDHDVAATHHEESFELDLDEAPAAPVHAPAATPAAPPPMALSDLAGSLEESLGDFAPAPPPTPAPRPTPPPAAAKAKPAPAAAPATPAKPAGKGSLADVFAEFKEEMEQDSAIESDIENHYNMGVAFKEMGLYDEAIGEFQKAYHGAENLPNNPNFIPVCTLLAHCFMEKNLPELAVRWLQNALKAPGLDREGEMALRYEIGSSQEKAGQSAAALESFMQVYALNIDYRDVADRIRSLKGN